MEIKLGSVWLLLSCSLQQSLLGTLAFVPHTSAKNCIGANGETGNKVQVIRRIPARCSGWEKTWSWASKTDCSTKYVYEYMYVAKASDPDEDCEEEPSASTEKDPFSVTEEKFLAIAFGSATVALLVLIVIIIISLLRRGQPRCASLCGGGQGYSSANIIIAGSERENNGQGTCNEYVDDGHRMSENMYEEIKDGNGTKAKFPVEGETERKVYPDIQDCPVKERSEMPINGVSNGVVIPSAPLEEDLDQTTHVKSVPNEYGSMTDSCAFNTSDSGTKDEQNISDVKSDEKEKDDDKDKKNGDGSRTVENAYSKFNDIIEHKQAEIEPVQPKAPSVDNTSPVQMSAMPHSYENLNTNMQNDMDGSGYDSLIKSQSDSGLSLTCANDVDGETVNMKVLAQESNYSGELDNVDFSNPSHAVTKISNCEMQEFT